MKHIPENSVDLVFADPPFNLRKKYSKYIDKKSEEDYINWCRTWLHELVRITKPAGAIFVHNIPRWLTYFAAILNEIAHFKNWIAWSAPGQPLGKTLYPAHYGILYYTKSEKNFKFYPLRYPHPRCPHCGGFLKDYGGKKHKMHPFGPLLSDIWTDIHRIRHKNKRDAHPCQLPIQLLERIILMCTDEGDIVLDPFLGTGTTAIAAKKLGRHFVGIEIDEKYAEIAMKKIEETSPLPAGERNKSIYLGKIITLRETETTHCLHEEEE